MLWIKVMLIDSGSHEELLKNLKLIKIFIINKLIKTNVFCL